MAAAFRGLSGRSVMSFRSLLAPALAAMALGASWQASAAPDLDLGAYKGKVVYVDFWASWCTPCRQSFPWMSDMQSQFGRQGFVVLAVNVDHDHAKAERFLEDTAPDFKIIFDPQGKIASGFASKYRTSGMPMSFLIGRDGRVRFSHVGFYENKESAYVSQIDELVSERAP